jgi:ligand-binding SRPBCC domain-containing protein
VTFPSFGVKWIGGLRLLLTQNAVVLLIAFLAMASETTELQIADEHRGGMEFTPHGRGRYRLTSAQFVPLPRAQVFEFFSDAFGLEDLTPPWLNFRVLTPAPIHMAAGLHIDYRLRLHGIPLRWQSRIDVWEPPFRFVDVQVRGPYKLWHHEHTFQEVTGGTQCRDIVDYAVPGGWLAERYLVRPDLQRIFRYRQARLRELLPGS